MAPGRFFRGKYHQKRQNNEMWFQGTPNQPRARTFNFMNNRSWQEQQMNGNWQNESPMSAHHPEIAFYSNSPGYLPNESFNDQRNMNFRRGTNYNRRGGGNRFGEGSFDERFSTQRKFEYNNNYFDPGFDNELGNNREVGFPEWDDFRGDFDENNFEVTNDRSVEFEDNSFYNEDVFEERNDSNANWMSFENDIEVTVQTNVPRRGFKPQFGNRAFRQVKAQPFKVNAQPFKKKGKKKFKKMIKKTFAMGQQLNSTPLRIVDPVFQYVLADFALNPNGTEERSSNLLSSGNDEYLIVDQTYPDTKRESEAKTSGAEIMISDSSEDSLGVEIIADKNDLNSDEKPTDVDVDVKPRFCAACNVYCLSEKNFETHNSSNNHLIKMGFKKKVVKMEEPVVMETEATERSEVPPAQPDPVLKSEEINEENEDKERSDDDIVEVENVGKVESEMTWNPDLVVGKCFMVQFTGFFCKLCKKYFNSIDRASGHCRSLVHFENYKSVKNGLSEVKAEVVE